MFRSEMHESGCGSMWALPEELWYREQRVNLRGLWVQFGAAAVHGRECEWRRWKVDLRRGDRMGNSLLTLAQPSFVLQMPWKRCLLLCCPGHRARFAGQLSSMSQTGWDRTKSGYESFSRLNTLQSRWSRLRYRSDFIVGFPRTARAVTRSSDGWRDQHAPRECITD
jgi:hypothetical protein